MAISTNRSGHLNRYIKYIVNSRLAEIFKALLFEKSRSNIVESGWRRTSNRQIEWATITVV